MDWVAFLQSQKKNSAIAVPNLPALPALKSWAEIAKEITPQNSAGRAIGAGSGTSSPFSTDWFSSFTDWFDPIRIVTVIMGLVLFAAGIFLLGKSEIIATVKDTVTGA